MGCLLPAHRSQRCAGRTRRLDQAQVADSALAAMEACLPTGSESDEGRDKQRASVAIRHQWAWSMVEWRRLAHEPSLSQVLVRPYGAGFAAGSSAALPVCFMNRRMRNRMSGGVGGRQG